MANKTPNSVTTQDEAKNVFQNFLASCSSETPTQCTRKTKDDYKFERQITVDNKIAFQTYGGCCMDIGRHIFAYNGSYSYRFTLYNLGLEQPSLKNQDIFDQILSTFKFLDEQGASGIYGTVTVGPTCPGPQKIGEICEKAYVGTVVIMKAGSANEDPTSLEEFTRFQTDQNGHFRLNLPAGDYIALPYPKSAVTFSKTQIHVEVNKFPEVNILFDTGIR